MSPGRGSSGSSEPACSLAVTSAAPAARARRRSPGEDLRRRAGADAIEFPARRYESLARPACSTRCRRRGSKEQLHTSAPRSARSSLGASKLGRGVVAARCVRAESCKAVGRLGYQASVLEVTDEGAVLATPTCPLRPLVRSHPEAAEIDRGMWSALVSRAAGVAVGHVECETKDCMAEHASCHVHISLS